MVIKRENLKITPKTKKWSIQNVFKTQGSDPSHLISQNKKMIKGTGASSYQSPFNWCPSYTKMKKKKKKKKPIRKLCSQYYPNN